MRQANSVPKIPCPFPQGHLLNPEPLTKKASFIMGSGRMEFPTEKANCFIQMGHITQDILIRVMQMAKADLSAPKAGSMKAS